MADIELSTSHGSLPAFFAKPEGRKKRPGMVIIHDAFGFSEDLRKQTEWLAGEGFVAVAPNLYSWGGRMRCMVSVIRNIVKRSGRAFDEVEVARTYLAGHPACNGKVGVIGFCMGGGFAVLLAPHERGFSAASVNYGSIPDDATDLLKDACPIVGSFGAKDKSLKGAAEKLDGILTDLGVPHDVKEYETAGHSFLNDHNPSDVPLIFRFAGAMIGGAKYDPVAAAEARPRISRFLHEHLD